MGSYITRAVHKVISGGPGGGSYQLAAGHWIPAKMSMTVVHPRPDNEITSTIARQQYAFADGTMQYRIPITIQGGAYPFYEAASYRTGFPSGMTINSDPASADYMVCTWTPTAGDTSTYTPSTRIYDQDGSYVTISWTVTAVGDTGTKFTFINPAAGTNGTGTKASPLNTMSGLAEDSAGSTISSFAGTIIVLRAGTTSFVGPDTTTSPHNNVGSIQLGTNNQNPYIFLGYTGETCNLDMSGTTGGCFKNLSGQSDVYFGGLVIKNLQTMAMDGTEVANTNFYFDLSVSHRVTFFENTFYNYYYNTGTGFGSNQGAVVAWNPSALRNYWAIINNTSDFYGCCQLIIFNVKYGVADRNTATTNTSGFNQFSILYLKSDSQNWSMRKNVVTGGKDVHWGIVGFSGQAQSYINDNIEFAYNAAYVDQTTTNSSATYNFFDNGLGETPHVWLYRNSFYGRVRHGDYAGYYISEKNVIINDGGFFGLASCCSVPASAGNVSCTACSSLSVTISGDVTGATTDGILDTSCNLTSSYKTANPAAYGTVGHEIA